jgi:SAM-dependent methyltransferase
VDGSGERWCCPTRATTHVNTTTEDAHVNETSIRDRADRLARRFVPAVPVLSHRRWLMSALDLFDKAWSLPFQEFRRLPPNHMRIRVGVGNRLVFNQPYYLEYGMKTMLTLMERGLMNMDSRIVDIGCGCGRLAHALGRSGFRGSYDGIDVDTEMLAWCKEHLGTDSVRFHHADVFSAIYNPSGQKGPYRLPLADGSTDLVTAQSLFTHLLEDDFRNYLNEVARVLEVGGQTYLSVFCLEDMADLGLVGGRWSLEQRVGNAHVESLEYPEAATAYTREFILDACTEAGFSEVVLVPETPQSVLVCRR